MLELAKVEVRCLFKGPLKDSYGRKEAVLVQLYQPLSLTDVGRSKIWAAAYALTVYCVTYQHECC